MRVVESRFKEKEVRFLLICGGDRRISIVTINVAEEVKQTE